jgi:hypothetical protein
VYQGFDVIPGQIVEVTVDAKRRNIVRGHGTHLQLEFHDSAGTMLLRSLDNLSWDADTWTGMTARSAVPENAMECRVVLVLQGESGQAWFSNCVARKIADPIPPPPEETVVLTVTDDVAIDSLIGFGAQDDGWFYTTETASYGADEEAYERRDGRIRWLDIDFVRMAVRYDDWYPGFATNEGDYTWDSDEMRSRYHALDVYQSIGAKVNAATVEWVLYEHRIPDWEALAHSVGDLMEYLIVTRGYTCIDTFTLIAEPTGHPLFKDYATYANYTRLVVAEFEERGLDLNIVGSDAGVKYLRQFVRDDEMFAISDICAARSYFYRHDPRLVAPFFQDNLDVLATRTPVRPFYMAEFGFIDERTVNSHVNPAMKEYSYAL